MVSAKKKGYISNLLNPDPKRKYMQYCVDCLYIGEFLGRTEDGEENYFCMSPFSSSWVSSITGKDVRNSCQLERERGCGREALGFQHKESSAQSQLS